MANLKTLHHAWLGELFSLLAGAALTLAFAPFSIFPLAVLSPAVLLAAWLPVSAKRAFWRGLLFGIGFFGTGISWVYVSIHDFGNLPVWLASLITFLFILILALFPAFQGYLFNRFFPVSNPIKIACAFPALWVLLEWVRSWFLSGFPWLFLGYSQIDTPLNGYAPLLGVYAISLAVLVSSGLLVNAVIAFRKQQAQKAYFYLLGMAFIWVLGGVLNFILWTTPNGKPLQASLIQGNVAQELKWVPEHIQPTLDLYQKLTAQHWDSSLIIWPEAAIPITLQDAEQYMINMSKEASKHHTTLITGIPVKATAESYYNAVIAVGNGSGIYAKQHLVPFGEFTPLKKYIGKLLDFFEIPMSDMIPPSEKIIPFLTANHIKITPFVCYEIAFPELQDTSQSGLLLIVTNDAWFGRSIAQAQHLEIARMRSIETGRPSLFVSNSGITAFITPTGKIQSAAPPYVEFVLTDTIQPMQGKTPWQRFHMDPLLLGLIILLIVSWKKRHAKLL